MNVIETQYKNSLERANLQLLKWDHIFIFVFCNIRLNFPDCITNALFSFFCNWPHFEKKVSVTCQQGWVSNSQCASSTYIFQRFNFIFTVLWEMKCQLSTFWGPVLYLKSFFSSEISNLFWIGYAAQASTPYPFWMAILVEKHINFRDFSQSRGPFFTIFSCRIATSENFGKIDLSLRISLQKMKLMLRNFLWKWDPLEQLISVYLNNASTYGLFP